MRIKECVDSLDSIKTNCWVFWSDSYELEANPVHVLAGHYQPLTLSEFDYASRMVCFGVITGFQGLGNCSYCPNETKVLEESFGINPTNTVHRSEKPEGSGSESERMKLDSAISQELPEISGTTPCSALGAGEVAILPSNLVPTIESCSKSVSGLIWPR